jgi:hypothetical protein
LIEVSHESPDDFCGVSVFFLIDRPLFLFSSSDEENNRSQNGAPVDFEAAAVDARVSLEGKEESPSFLRFL